MMKPHYGTLCMVRTYSTTRLAKREEMEEAKSTSGKLKLSLSLNPFKKTSKEELYIRKMTLPQVPNNNTSANTRWTIKIFTDWFAAHNSDATDDDLCPEEVLSPSCTGDLLNRWLCVFISETRAHNGEECPPRTLYSILTGILRYMYNILFYSGSIIILCYLFNSFTSKVLTNHSACIKHQRVIHALSAMYHIYIPVKSFELWLHHDI